MAVKIFGGDGNLSFIASLDTNPFIQGRQVLSKEFRMITQEAGQQAASMDALYKKAFSAISAYASLTAGTNLIKDIIKVRGEFESLQVAFETMLGSKQKADQLMSEVVKFAATTPYGLTEVAGVTKQLLAYGFAADKIEDTLRRLGDVASGVSAPLGDIAYLYGTILTAGKANSVDIKQFGQRGIPIYEALAKVMKVNVDQVNDLVSAGKVGFPQIEAAFKSLTDTGSQFGGLMEKTSHTLKGVVSNLSDSFDQMLNNIGKSNSGLAYSVLGFAKDAVDNYQKIVDILKVAVTVYGSYKTAVLLSVAAERLQQEAMLQTALAGGTLSKSQAALAVSQRLLQGGFKSIADTLLTPTAAATTAIAGLSFIVYSLTQVVDAAAESQKNLAEIEAAGTKSAVKEKDTIASLVSVMHDKTRSHQDQITAINKLRDITGPYLKGYTDEQILAGQAKDAIDQYIGSIEQMSKVKAASEKLTELEGKLIDIETKGGDALSFAERFGNSMKALVHAGDYSKHSYWDQFFGKDGATVNDVSVEKAKSDIQKQIDDIKGVYSKGLEDLALTGGKAGQDIASNASNLTNRQLVDTAKSLEELDTLRKKINESYEGATDQTNRNVLASDLKYLDARKKAFDSYSADKQSKKTNEEAIRKVNSLYEQQRTLLEQINALHHDAIQSGLLKQESEVDKINEKYNTLLQSIKEQNELYDKISKQYPGGVSAYNRQNPNNRVQRIDQATINGVNTDRATELNNADYKADADRYLKHLDDLKNIFTQYQDSIKEIGKDRADELYKDQTKGFDNYIDYLKDQEAKVKATMAAVLFTGGVPDIGSQLKLQGIGQAEVDATKEANDEQYNDTKESYTSLIQLTDDFYAKRRRIDAKYAEDRKLLMSTYKGEDLNQRLAALQENRDKSIDAAKDEVFQKTELYQKLNDNVIELSRKQAREQIEAIKTILDTGVDIPDKLKEQLQAKLTSLQTSLNFSPRQNHLKALLEQKALIDAALHSGMLSTEEYEKQYKKLLDINKQISEEKKRNDKLAASLSKVSSDILQVSGSISNLASSLGDSNDGLSATVETLGDIGNVVGSAVGAAASLASGDIAGFISGTINTIASIFTIGKKARESECKANEELKKYQDDLIKSGVTYNELIRQRLRDQQDINELASQELQTRLQMLATQRQQAQADYERLLAQVRAGKQVLSESTEKYGGVFGIGRKTRVVQQTAGLTDASYDQLEELFTEGKLDKATADWFTELQKSHEEINGISDSLKETSDRLTEVLTGTTSEALSDSIAEGFRNGYSSVYDFGDTINDVIRNALFSAFETNIIKPAMQPLYDELGQLASDGLDIFDINKFRTDANTALAPLLSQIDAIKQAAGDLFSTGAGSSQNSLIGEKSQATEQTTQLLAGQIGGLRLTAAEQADIATRTLVQINLIAAYTSDIPNLLALWRDIKANGLKVY